MAANNRFVIVAANLICCILESSCACLSKKTGASVSDIHLCVGAANFFLSHAFFLRNPQTTELRRLGSKNVSRLVLNGILFYGFHWVLYYRAFYKIHYGDLNAIFYSSLLLTCVVLEFVQFRKSPSWITCLASGLCVTGLVLLAVLPRDNQHWAGINWSQLEGLICTATAGAFCGIFYQMIRPHCDISVTFHWYCCALGFFIFPFAQSVAQGFETSKCLMSEKSIIIAASIIWCISNYSSIFASQHSIPSVSFVIRFFIIVLGYVLQIVFLNEQLTLFTGGAVSLVLIGVLIQGIATAYGKSGSVELDTGSKNIT